MRSASPYDAAVPDATIASILAFIACHAATLDCAVPSPRSGRPFVTRLRAQSAPSPPGVTP
jgi:hypothetical protein